MPTLTVRALCIMRGGGVVCEGGGEEEGAGEGEGEGKGAKGSGEIFGRWAEEFGPSALDLGMRVFVPRARGECRVFERGRTPRLRLGF